MTLQEQLNRYGFHNQVVLDAMESVPRQQFVPDPLKEQACSDSALPIGKGQTISQPYMVAYMTWKLQVCPDDRVLEIGTGSGYQAAVLSRLVREVVSLEIIPELADRARETLKDLEIANVTVLTRDGHEGCPERAPFDSVIATAAPPKIPPVLVDQLKVGGRMIVPVGEQHAPQQLRLLTKSSEEDHQVEDVLGVRFVPFTGKESAQ